MDKRIGTAVIVIENKAMASKVNHILSRYADLILGRQGIPLHKRQLAVISLVLEGTTDQIGALAGQVGRIKGVQIKTALTKPLGAQQTTDSET